ncbi:MAG: glutamyl-tRNA reductase [Chloroflexota bacterium]
MNQHILMMGLNHTTAPIDVREGVACTRHDLAQALPQLVSPGGPGAKTPLTEGLILSTCNRTEIYAVTDDLSRSEDWLREFFAARLMSWSAALRLRSATPGHQPLAQCLYMRRDREAVRHLFSVACGLDSMILGEFEILGQVRAAYELAAQHRGARGEQAPLMSKTIGPILSALFHAAVHTGKRARSETAIGRGAASAAYAAVQLARKEVGDLRDRSVLVIGAGEMGQRVAQGLQANGARPLSVASRNYDHAVTLARHLGGRAIQFEELEDALRDADVAISATGAPHLVLHATTVARALSARPQRTLCIIDIAVPRDVDPAAAQIPNVHLCDLDDLQTVARENILEREKEVMIVQGIIAEEAEEFWRWYSARPAAPVIGELCQRAEAIRAAELSKAMRRLGHLHLSERDRNVIAALSEGIVGKLLAAPMARLKEHAQNGDGQMYLDAVSELFELTENVKREA